MDLCNHESVFSRRMSAWYNDIIDIMIVAEPIDISCGVPCICSIGRNLSAYEDRVLLKTAGCQAFRATIWWLIYCFGLYDDPVVLFKLSSSCVYYINHDSKRIEDYPHLEQTTDHSLSNPSLVLLNPRSLHCYTGKGGAPCVFSPFASYVKRSVGWVTTDQLRIRKNYVWIGTRRIHLAWCQLGMPREPLSHVFQPLLSVDVRSSKIRSRQVRYCREGGVLIQFNDISTWYFLFCVFCCPQEHRIERPL